MTHTVKAVRFPNDITTAMVKFDDVRGEMFFYRGELRGDINAISTLRYWKFSANADAIKTMVSMTLTDGRPREMSFDDSKVFDAVEYNKMVADYNAMVAKNEAH